MFNPALKGITLPKKKEVCIHIGRQSGARNHWLRHLSKRGHSYGHQFIRLILLLKEGLHSFIFFFHT